jgi:hypothetical protein
MNLSQELIRYKNNKENILTHIKKHGILKVHQFCSNSGLPLAVVWYYVQENFDEHREEAQEELKRICKFYRLTVDVELRGIDKAVETCE